PKQLEGLHELRLLCTNGKLVVAKECYLADAYEPALKLQDRNKLGEFVSPEYKQANDLASEWKSFFMKIGVNENISLVYVTGQKDVTKSVATEYFDVVGQEAQRGHRHPHLVGADNRVRFDKITYCQFAVDYQFSKLFWEQAFAHVNIADVKAHASMPWGYYGSYEHVTNYFHWFLDNQPVFPTSQRTC
nr:hypothetical protein [Tanacetum cinerariifolium]